MKTFSRSLMVFAVLLFAGCSSNDTPKTSDTKDSASAATAKAERMRAEQDAKELSALNELATRLDIPSQHFSIPANKPSTVTGKKGTIIHVNPTDLVTASGAAPTGTIDIELKELTTKSDMLMANAPTVSDGKMLVSGGAYYIGATAGGEPLQLKSGKTMQVQFPQFTTEPMQLFYGERDSAGKMNWKQSEKKFEWVKTSDSNTSNSAPTVVSYVKPVPAPALNGTVLYESTAVSKQYYVVREYGNNGPDDNIYSMEDSMGVYKLDSANPWKGRSWARRVDTSIPVPKTIRRYREVYNAIEINKLGWINCDAFANSTKYTSLTLRFNPSDSIRHVNTYLVFKSLNSVIPAHLIIINDSAMGYGFSKVPVDANATIVAFTIKGDSVKANVTNVLIKEDQPPVTLPMQTTTEQKLKQMMDLK